MPTTSRRRSARVACGAVALLAGCSGSAATTAADPTAAGTTGAPSSAATTAATATPATTAASTTRATTARTTAPVATTPASTAAATTAPAAPTAAAAGTTALTVESGPDKYHVLYLKPVPSGSTELPVAVVRGRAGTVTLSDGRTALPAEHYRVQTFDVASPGDVDADGTDDLTELDDARANPLNPAPAMDLGTGAVLVPDRATYEELSYQGSNVGRDSYLAGLEVMKFIITGTTTAHPAVYFMNTNRYNAHPVFAQTVGIPGVRGGPSAGVMRGDVVYEPERVAADGTKGVYRFAFQPSDAYSFGEIALAYELLTTSMPFLEGRLSYYAFASAAYPLYVKEKARYDAYRVAVIKGDA